MHAYITCPHCGVTGRLVAVNGHAWPRCRVCGSYGEPAPSRAQIVRLSMAIRAEHQRLERLGLRQPRYDDGRGQQAAECG